MLEASKDFEKPFAFRHVAHQKKIMFRIKKYDKGFVVEVQKSKWYGKKYWTHFISIAGLANLPFYFSTYDGAMSETLKDIKWQTIINSRNR